MKKGLILFILIGIVFSLSFGGTTTIKERTKNISQNGYILMNSERFESVFDKLVRKIMDGSVSIPVDNEVLFELIQ